MAAAAGPALNGTVAGTNVAVGFMPAVNGESETEETPEKAGACVTAAGSGAAVVLDGLRTLGIRVSALGRIA